MKKNGFAPILILIIAVLGTAGYFAYKNQLLSAWIGKTFQATTRSKYTFEWNDQAKTAIVFKDNSQINSFNLAEKPLDVFYYIPGNILAIVTEDKNSLQHLYIYKNGKLTKIHSGEKFAYSEDLKDLLPTRIEGEGFSPDGDYFLTNEFGWEVGAALIFSTNSFKKIEGKDRWVFPFASVFWHPQNLCFLNIGTLGMYPPFNFFQVKNTTYEGMEIQGLVDDLSYDYDNNKTTVWWNDDCSGVIRLENEKGIKSFYKFDSQGGKLQLTNKSSINKLQKSSNINQEHIYSQE